MSASLIQNLVARLTMDSSGFEGPAKRSAQTLRGMTAGTLALQRTVVGLAGAYLSVRGLINAVQSLSRAAIEAESSDRSLISAMKITGQLSAANAQLLDRHAESMQDLTRYSINQIKQQQAFALTMGAGVGEVRGMTEAAIGLSAAYGKDLHTAMRMIALARQGETGQLKEMGIVLDRTKTKQAQYDQLLGIGRQNMVMATEDGKTLGGTIASLGNEWEQTKASLMKPFTPYLITALRAIRNELDAMPKGQTAWNNIKALPDAQQEGIWKAYRQRLQEQAQSRMPNGYTATQNDWREDPAYLARLTAAYARSGDIQARIKGTDGASEVGPASAAAREQVVKLNEDLKHQIQIQRELAAGNLSAAETVRFMLAAEEAYGKGTQANEAAVTKYRSALEHLRDLESAEKVRETVDALQSENDTLALIRQGRQGEARVLEIINDLKRQGIALSDEEKKRIEGLIQANEKLRKGYGNDVMGGIRGGLSQMQDELGGLGDLSFDLIRDGVDGVAASIADAATRTGDWNENIKEVGRSMARMAAEWATKQIIVGGLSAAFGSAPVAHSGGVIGSDTFPTRRVSPALFAYAPRLHSGLASDEFPAILQRGEEVRSRSQVAADRSGGGKMESQLWGRMVTLLERIAAKEMSVTVPVALDPEEIVRRGARTREGRRAIAMVVEGAE